MSAVDLHESGIILIDKPAGITSANALNTIKRTLNLEKLGHTGTLDPMATGLLVGLVGGATRLGRFVDCGFKTYTGKIKLGLTTDTDDVTGKQLTSSTIVPPIELIHQAISNFVGEIKQVPPQVSAVKFNGKRSYKYAREGERVELEPRSAIIKEFLIDTVTLDVIRFQITCSRGTYIRSLARDLGALLGCGGCLKSLRREKIGEFCVSSAKQLDIISRHDIVPMSELLSSWHCVCLSDDIAESVRSGDQRKLSEIVVDSDITNKEFILYAAQSNKENFLGVLEKKNEGWQVAFNF